MAAKIRCLVGLFGLDRSLRWTGSSIRHNLLDPLRANGCALTLVAHFNQPKTINNPRSGERSVAVRRPRRDMLPFDLCWREPQAEPSLVAELAHAPFRDERVGAEATRRNLALQLHSLARLRTLIDLVDNQQLFLLIRPDLEYLDRIDFARDVVPVLDGTVDIMTPDWHTWEGLNDRFCIANAAGAHAYLDRGAIAQDFADRRGYIHSEELLADAIGQAGLRAGQTPLRARRVRATGDTLPEGFDLGRTDFWRMRLRPWRQRLFSRR